MEFHGNIVADVLQIIVLAGRLAIGQIVLPVGTPLDLHAFLGDEGPGTSHRLMVFPLGIDERLIVVGPGLVVVVHFGLIRVVEELGKPFHA